MSIKTLLIVDDDPMNIKIINELLLSTKSPKYEVLNASNAKLGLTIAESVQPNLIITDWEMPEMNGIEFIKRLKKNGKTKEIPVIMASGIMTTSEDLDLALSAGAEDYIRKPIDKIELLARVRSIMAIADQIKEIREQKEIIIEQQKQLHDLELSQLKKELFHKEKEASSSVNFMILNETEKTELIEKIGKLEPYLNSQGKVLLKSYFADIKQWENNFSLTELENKFDQINSTFYERLIEVNPSITKNEKILSTFMAMDLSPSEIALITKRSLNSINVAFSRLREKFEQPTNAELKAKLRLLKS
ncbi:MAG: DNA-binding response OmpR family regulator [Crocinitomicaceae bacterium]|jgi:DNA-binding response OmpR family regulator